MTEYNTDVTSETSAEHNDDSNPDMLRREFLKRFGVYAAGSAVGLYVLMSGKTSAVAGSLIQDTSAAPPQEPAKQQPFQYKEYK